MSQSDRGDDSQDLAGSRISRIRAASRRLYMTPNSSSPGGTSSDYFSATVHMQSHVAVSSLPKRNTLLEPKWCTAELGRLPDRHGAWP